MFFYKYAHFFVLGLALSALFFGVAGNHGLLVLGELQQELSGLEAEKHRLESEISTLREQIELIEVDDEVLEKLAREELGLSRDGEIVYHFQSE